jgi:hypothetical protein
MSSPERLRLLRALAKASNAFHESLKQDGYSVSYGLGKSVGSLYDLNQKEHDRWPLGEIEIKWRVKK